MTHGGNEQLTLKGLEENPTIIGPEYRVESPHAIEAKGRHLHG